jgi:hypothetical protein
MVCSSYVIRTDERTEAVRASGNSGTVFPPIFMLSLNSDFFIMQVNIEPSYLSQAAFHV